jgi:hypothetical protein
MRFLKRLDKVVFPDSQQITEEMIEHYEKNPDELDLIINREYFNAVYLGIVFLIGIIITILPRITQYFYGSILGDFVNHVLLDVISELGIAIFGGAIVAYLIEFLNKQQFQRNIAFRREMKGLIENRKKNRR